MTKIQPRRGTAAQWSAANPTLAIGELGYETDTRKQKRGDGSTAWNDLGYDGNDAVGTSLTQVGLTNATTDIGALINAAFADGYKHLIVPYRAEPWPALTKIAASDVWLEFEAGARISFDHALIGLELTESRLTNGSFTSIHTGPASSEDATSATYAYPARSVVVRDNVLIDGSYYQEHATEGIVMLGAHIRITCALRFKNLRHQRGWAHAVHAGGSDVHDVRCTGPVIIEDCDRGIENEDGAHDIVYSGGGYLKNVYPNGYAGQGSAVTYENYTFVLDAHAHEGSGGVQGIQFDGTWVVENCGGGVSFIRSNGTNDADLPRNCGIQEVRFIGRALASGYKDIDLQGRNHRVGRAHFDVGAGIAGGTFYINGQAASANNVVESVAAESAATPMVTDSGTGLRVGAVDPWPLPSASRAGKFVAFPQGPTTPVDTLGNETLRLTPVYVSAALTIDQLGVEITSAGDVDSVVRIGVYSDKNGLPGNPLADVAVAADVVDTPMGTLGSALTLGPGWYHFGGAVQGVTVTQPTVRAVVSNPPGNYLIFNPAATAASPIGYSRGSVAGALPAYGATISTTNVAPRIWARVAA